MVAIPHVINLLKPSFNSQSAFNLVNLLVKVIIIVPLLHSLLAFSAIFLIISIEKQVELAKIIVASSQLCLKKSPWMNSIIFGLSKLNNCLLLSKILFMFLL